MFIVPFFFPVCLFVYSFFGWCTDCWVRKQIVNPLSFVVFRYVDDLKMPWNFVSDRGTHRRELPSEILYPTTKSPDLAICLSFPFELLMGIVFMLGRWDRIILYSFSFFGSIRLILFFLFACVCVCFCFCFLFVSCVERSCCTLFFCIFSFFFFEIIVIRMCSSQTYVVNRGWIGERYMNLSDRPDIAVYFLFLTLVFSFFVYMSPGSFLLLFISLVVVESNLLFSFQRFWSCLCSDHSVVVVFVVFFVVVVTVSLYS